MESSQRLILPGRGFIVPDALKIPRPKLPPFRPRAPSIIRRRSPLLLTPAYGNNAGVTLVASGTSIGVASGYPAGISAGDILLFYVFGNDGVGGSCQWSTAPTGFTMVTSTIAGRRAAGLAFRVASGSESGTVTFSPSTNTNGTGNAIGDIASYTGAAATPIGGNSSAATNAGSTTVAFPNFSSTTDNSLIVEVVAFENTGTCSAPSGSSLAWTQDALGAATWSIAWGSAPQATHGLISSVTATLGTSAINCVAGAALKPGAAAASFLPRRDPMAHMLVR